MTIKQAALLTRMSTIYQFNIFLWIELQLARDIPHLVFEFFRKFRHSTPSFFTWCQNDVFPPIAHIAQQYFIRVIIFVKSGAGPYLVGRFARKSLRWFLSTDRFAQGMIIAGLLIIFFSPLVPSNGYNRGEIKRGDVTAIGSWGGADALSYNDRGKALAGFDERVVVAYAALRAQLEPPQHTQVVVRRVVAPVTAYSSTPDQTDSTPFITASGTRVRDGVVAANFLPIGTKVRMPTVYGDKIFIVEDRMNSRYWQRLDIWMETRQEALQFGVRTLPIEIIREI